MTRVSDTPPKYSKSFAHSIIAPIGAVADLQSANGLFNDLMESVKRFGSIVIAEGITAASGHALVMATGSAYNAKWGGLNITDDVSVTADSTAVRDGTDNKPVMKKRLLGSLDFPVVQEADINDGNHVINSHLVGGKRFGAGVVVKTAAGRFVLALAGGTNAQDKWYGIDGTQLYSPTAETVSTAPFDKKPVAKEPVVTAIPFSVTTEEELVVAAKPVNSGDGVSSGKRKGALIVTYAAAANPLVPKLYMALGDAPTSKWALLLGDDATGAVTPA